MIDMFLFGAEDGETSGSWVSPVVPAPDGVCFEVVVGFQDLGPEPLEIGGL